MNDREGHQTTKYRQSGLPRRALDTAAREGKFEAEGWRIRKDGSRFWAHVVIDPIRGTGVALEPVDEGFEILRIFDGTPAADSDLQIGDLVVAINGVAVNGRGCDTDFRAEDEVVYSIRRDGEDLDVTVAVIDLLP